MSANSSTRRRTTALLALAFVISTLQTAGAAPTWKPEETIDPANAIADVKVAVDGDGNAVATYGLYDSDTQTQSVWTAYRPRGGHWGNNEQILDPLYADDPVIASDRKGRALAAWRIRTHPTNPNLYHLRVAQRSRSGSWSWSRRLSSEGMTVYSPMVLVTNSRGDALLAWRESDPSDPSGDVFIKARLRPAGGVWGPSKTISGAGYAASDIVGAIDESGNVALIFERFETGNFSTHTLNVITRDAEAGRWEARQPLGPPGNDSVGDADVDIDAAGNPMAVFTLHDPDTSTDRIVYAEPGSNGVWQDPQILQDPVPLATRVELEMERNGDALAIWKLDDGSGIHLVAADRPAGGAWATPNAIHNGFPEFGDPNLLMNRSGDAVVGWVVGAVTSHIKAVFRVRGGDWPDPDTGSTNITPAGDYASDWAGDVTPQGDAILSYAHTVEDPPGVFDSSAASSALDVTGPKTTMRRPSRRFQNDDEFVVRWSALDAFSSVDSFDVMERVVSLQGNDSGPQLLLDDTPDTYVNVSREPGNTYCFSASATDDVGNTGPTTRARCTAVPLDDTALRARGAWDRETGRGYYLGTYSQSSRDGAALIKKVHAKRITLIATRCDGCGRVRVSFAGRLLDVVDLDANKTRKAVMHPMPGFGQARTGRLKIAVVTSQKTVRIEGVGVSAR